MFMSEEVKAVPLSTMLEDADEFVVKGTKYMIRPLYLSEVSEFMKDGLSVGPQLVNLSDETRAKDLDKWIQRTVSCTGSPMSLDKLKDNKWTIKDMKKLLLKLVDLSG
jgi:hypothetical protein